MEPPERRDLVCLYLAAAGATTDGDGAASATAIGDALAVGDTAASRVGLLEDLAALEDAGLVESAGRSPGGQDPARTVYALTAAGREHAETVRRGLQDETVVVEGETTEAVPLGDVDRYVEGSPSPLVAALARLTDDGRVPLATEESETFVDREAPLSTVEGALADAIEREGRTVVVAGAAGMGKTALVSEAVRRVAADRPDLVQAWGDCPPGATPPYGPLRQAFERVPGGEGLLDRLADAAAPPPPAAGAPERAADRRAALFDDVAADLRAVATEQPVVVVLDNLQWADDATVDLFVHLARTVTEWVYPVAFVATVRSAALAGEDPPLRSTLAALSEGGGYEEVTLEAFDRADTRALLSTVVGHQRPPDAFVDVVHERTGGVPLYVRETATHLLERGTVDPAAGRWPTDPGEVALPDAIDEQIDDRLAVLDDDSRDLLRLGAVVGEHVPGPVLAAGSDLDPATRREHVDLLVASRIWERVTDEGAVPAATAADGGATDVRFVSGGVREALVERLPPDDARAYHRRAGEAYVAAYEDLDERAAPIAYHFERAGDHERAVAYYRRAGDHAKASYANEDAVEQYERALKLGADADGVEPATLAAVARDLAAVYETLGEFDAAIETVDEWLSAAPERSRERARLLGAKAAVLSVRGDYEAVRDVAGRQRELAADLDATDVEAVAIRRLGFVAQRTGAYDRAHDRYERSLAMARELDDRHGEADALERLASVAHSMGEYDRAREYAEDGLALTRELGDREREAAALDTLAMVTQTQGDYAATRRYERECLAIYRELGHRWGEARVLGNLGLVAERVGEYDEAVEHLERGLALFRELGARKGETMRLNNLGLATVRRGELDRAEDCFGQGLQLARELELPRREGNALNGLGHVARMRGEFAAARDHHEAALAVTRDIDMPRREVDSLNKLGKVARWRGDREAARERFEAALELARDIDHPREAGKSLTGLGRVALDAGEHDRASERFEAALDAFVDAENRIETAQARLARARLALARGDHATARERARDVHAEFAAMHTAQWAGRARRLRGEVTAAEGDHDAAREHLRGALDVAETVGAPQDALAALEHLVAVCRAAGDEDAAAGWCERAREVLAAAPDATADLHREWVERDCEDA